MREDLPLPAFHFQVSFNKLPGDNGSDNQFLSISGLQAGLSTITIPLLPTTTGPANIVWLRRAIRQGKTSPLRKWILKGLSQKETPVIKEMLITILSEEHKPAMVFRLKDISPAGWELGELNAGKSELLMENIFLRYRSVIL